MEILITNDDGIYAPGIEALASALSSIGRVTVVAPRSEESGGSQSITIHEPLRFKKVNKGDLFFGYAVDGTPADCVKLGLFDILPKAPDFVVSGINRGPNNAMNILYSGTVGGAFEGAVNNIPSIAVSLAGFDWKDYDTSALFTRDFISLLWEIGANKNTVYNVNVPAVSKSEIYGVKWTKMAMSSYLVNYEKRNDPFGEPYYWLSDFRRPVNAEISSDDEALEKGFISVTPLKVDRTDYNELDKLKQTGDGFWSNK